MITRQWNILTAPMPPDREPIRLYPFGDLGEGQCFQMPYKRGLADRIRAAGYRWCERRGIPPSFRVRVVLIDGVQVVRCWRLTPTTDDQTTDAPGQGPFSAG